MTEYPEVVGLGSSTVDVISLVDTFPQQEGVLEAKDMIVQGGGPIATAMVTLARLGTHAAMLDVIGDDWVGNLILSEFRREGVSTDFIRIVNGASSSVSTILVDRTGDRVIVFQRGDAPEFSSSDIPDEVINAAKIVHMNGRHWAACLAVCEVAQHTQTMISFDGGANRYHPKFVEIVPYLDICILARDFAENYSGKGDAECAADLLLQQGVSLVVITDGDKGSQIRSVSGERFHQPSYELTQIVDTTGAGDVYHGAFLYGLLQQNDLRTCAKIASAAAAIKCQSLGGRSAIPDISTLQAFMAKFE